MRSSKRHLRALCAAVAIAGCGGGGDGTPANPDLETYDAGFFSIQKPRGWSVVVAGRCETLAVLLRDPAEPLRQIFYFGTVGPLYLTAQQKQLDQYYVDHGGFPISWIDAPVIDPLTPTNLMGHWPEIAAMDAAGAFMPGFPELEGLTLVSTTARPSMLTGATTGESRGLFTAGGRVGEGMFLSSVMVFMPVNGNPGAGTAYAHFVCGVTAPKPEFAAKANLLVESLNTFSVTQEYVNGCLKQAEQEWGAVARAGQTLSEASDLLWEGWVDRTHGEDVSAEQYSDAFRGVERVYDPATGTVYEVPNGWFETYDAHRGDYTMNGLEQLPDANWNLWMKPTTSGDQIH